MIRDGRKGWVMVFCAACLAAVIPSARGEESDEHGVPAAVCLLGYQTAQGNGRTLTLWKTRLGRQVRSPEESDGQAKNGHAPLAANVIYVTDAPAGSAEVGRVVFIRYLMRTYQASENALLLVPRDGTPPRIFVMAAGPLDYSDQVVSRFDLTLSTNMGDGHPVWPLAGQDRKWPPGAKPDAAFRMRPVEPDHPGFRDFEAMAMREGTLLFMRSGPPARHAPHATDDRLLLFPHGSDGAYLVKLSPRSP